MRQRVKNINVPTWVAFDPPPPQRNQVAALVMRHASPEMETLQRYDAKTSRLAASSVEKHQIFHIGLYNNS